MPGSCSRALKRENDGWFDGLTMSGTRQPCVPGWVVPLSGEVVVGSGGMPMLKRLLMLMGAAEAAGWRVIGPEISSPGTCEKPTREDYERAMDSPDYMDFGVVYTHAVLEGISEESAFVLGSAYARMLAEGMSKAYAIVYAAAYSIACTLIGASEQWARAYAQACAHVIAARESVGFAAVYGHAIAEGASPEDARAFARRYAV